ncbi:MAG: cupin domain-containing protein [Promethearchaeota archaeon]
MQIVHEKDQEDKDGVKYMVRGPNIDWGTITLQPGQKKSAHFHEILAETFYVTEGVITFILNDQNIDIQAGSAIRLEKTETHGLENRTVAPAKLIFIKEQYLPHDKVNC